MIVEDIENGMHPKVLSRLKEEYLDTHHRLQHMPPLEIFTLCDHNHLPKRYLRLKVKPPSCMSCAKVQRRTCRNIENNNKSIRKPSHSKPGKCTSIDQIVSAQPDLDPRIYGCHTIEIITSATSFLS